METTSDLRSEQCLVKTRSSYFPIAIKSVQDMVNLVTNMELDNISDKLTSLFKHIMYSSGWSSTGVEFPIEFPIKGCCCYLYRMKWQTSLNIRLPIQLWPWSYGPCPALTWQKAMVLSRDPRPAPTAHKCTSAACDCSVSSQGFVWTMGAIVSPNTSSPCDASTQRMETRQISWHLAEWHRRRANIQTL